MRGDLFHRQPTALHSRDRVAVQVTSAGQWPPGRRETVLQPADQSVRHPYVLQQPHTPARADGTTNLGERSLRVRDGTQREPDDRAVERALPKGKRLGISGHQKHGGADTGGARAGPLQHVGVHVSANDNDARVVVAEVEARAGTDFEHASVRGVHDRSAPASERAGFGRAHHRVVDPREKFELHGSGA